MQTYRVELQSAIATSYRATRAANSLDIDVASKSKHTLEIEADITSPFNVGLIVGASGSGKTTLARQIYGDDFDAFKLDEQRPIIDQFPEEMSYEQCVDALTGIGLSAVPCWIRPVCTLSNGQKSRATATLSMLRGNPVVVDEFTSVVDRTVAKVMAHCVQKFARKNQKQIVLLSCHYDVVEWLNPCWIIDCNAQKFIDRRLLQRDYKRPEQLQFDVRVVDRSSWRYFSKYHYLSERLPGGRIETFGLFCGDNQIGFQCFANYVPRRSKMERMIMHSNRTVLHPDYQGLGLGIKLINATSQIMHEQGYKIMAKFSSVPVYKAMIRDNKWKLLDVKTQVKNTIVEGNMLRRGGFREKVKTYSLVYRPK